MKLGVIWLKAFEVTIIWFYHNFLSGCICKVSFTWVSVYQVPIFFKLTQLSHPSHYILLTYWKSVFVRKLIKKVLCSKKFCPHGKIFTKLNNCLYGILPSCVQCKTVNAKCILARKTLSIKHNLPSLGRGPYFQN